MIDSVALARLRAQTHEQVGAVLDRSPRWVMADFPRHPNVGDSLIWSGERQMMKARGIEVVHTCDRRTYSARKVAAVDAPILIHGGGNFGDLYKTHHELRKKLLANHRDRPIVQLPQSIRFGDRAELELTRRLVACHGMVTIVVRDRPSYEFATANFQAEILLAPDSALALAALRRLRAPSADILWQARVDKEAADGEIPAGVETFDWLEEPRDESMRGRLTRLERGLSTAASLPIVINTTPLYDRYAQLNRDRGLDYLSDGRVLVTDRLHGHVLACLMGMPHVVIGDRHGKIRNLWDRWTGGLGGLWAESPAEAYELARGLL